MSPPRKVFFPEEMKKRIFAPIPPDPPLPLPDARDNLPGICGNDPMSPYVTPTSRSIFNNLTDVLNNKSFAANFPQSYTPVSTYFLNNGFTPYFNPGEDTDYAPGAITIAGMIELTYQNQPWKLTRDQDIEIIINIAQAYLRNVELSPTSKKLTQYADRVRFFLSVMEKSRSRLYKRHGKENPFALNIISLFKRLFREPK